MICCKSSESRSLPPTPRSTYNLATITEAFWMAGRTLNGQTSPNGHCYLFTPPPPSEDSQGDVVDAGAGDDYVLSGLGADRVQGGDGSDKLFGMGGDDTGNARAQAANETNFRRAA